MHRPIPTALLWLLLGITLAPAPLCGQVPRPVRWFGLGELRSLAATPDGEIVLSVGTSGVIQWDGTSGTVLRILEDHRAPVTAVAVSPDGSHAATAGRDQQVRLWSTRTGESLGQLTGHRGAVVALAFSPDGKQLASSSEDNTTRVWSLETRLETARVTTPGFFHQAARFTPDGLHLLTSDSAFTNGVRLWRLADLAEVRTFGLHVGSVPALATVSSNRLVTGGEDRKVRLWDWQTGALLRELPGATALVHSLFTVSGRTEVVGACQDGRILAWNVETGEVVRNLPSPPSLEVRPGPEPDLVFVAYSDGLIRLLSLATGETLRALDGHFAGALQDVDFSPDGTQVAAGGVDAWTRVWTRTTGALERKLPQHPSGTAAVRFSPDGTRILTTQGVPSKVARLWNARTGEWQQDLTGHTDWLLAAAFSADGSRVVTGGLDRTVRVWNSDSGVLLRTWTGHEGWVHAVAVSPDGSWVASGASDSTARLWNVQTGMPAGTHFLNAGTVKAVAFAPDRSEFAAGWEDGVLRIFSLETGQVRLEIVTRSGFLNDLSYSPDGQYLLTAEGWPWFAATLWDARTGESVRVLPGHTAPVTAAVFNTRGTAVLTASDTVRLWDVSDLAGRISIQPDASGPRLVWAQGELEQAPSPGGPWQTVPGASSPWVPPGPVEPVFFRTRIIDAP